MKRCDAAVWIKADAAAGGCGRGTSGAQSQKEWKARMKSWRGAERTTLLLWSYQNGISQLRASLDKEAQLQHFTLKRIAQNFIDFLWYRSPVTQNACFFLSGWGRAAVPGHGGVMYLSSVFIMLPVHWLDPDLHGPRTTPWQRIFLCLFCSNHRLFGDSLTALTLTAALMETYKCQRWHEGPSSPHARQYLVEVRRLITEEQPHPQPCLTPKGKLLL